MTAGQLGWFATLEWDDDHHTRCGSFRVLVQPGTDGTWYVLQSMGHDHRVHDLNPTHRAAMAALGLGNAHYGRGGLAKAKATAQAIVDRLQEDS